MAHTIDAALVAHNIDRTIVSTDDAEIAKIAAQYGAETPFLRPAELAADDTPSYPVVVHATQWLEEHQAYLPDYLILLQPTSPLRTAEDIDNSITIALENDAVGVVSVCQAKHHPYWIKRLTSDGRIANFIPLDKPYNRRQDLPPAYALNGAIYLVKREVLFEKETLCPEGAYAYVMPPERSLDVDTPWDFRMAEQVLNENQLS